MENKAQNRKLEWIIILILVLALIITTVVYYNSGNKQIPDVKEAADNQAIEVMKDYEELERAYDKAIRDLEFTIQEGGDDVGISALKENLSTLLLEIKAEKEQIKVRQGDRIRDSLSIMREQQQELKDMLEMSKEVLIERLAQLQMENKQLATDNDKLAFQNDKLFQRVDKANKLFEEEKSKNTRLNDEVSRVKNEIKKLETTSTGTANNAEIEKLKQEMLVYQEKLDESNRVLESQNMQINELGSVLRKVNVECSFIFEKGNPEEEAKIFVTSKGLSGRYLKYFMASKPDITFEFNINDYLFEEGVERLDFKVFNSNNVEIYSSVKSIDVGTLQIVVPGRTFTTQGQYHAILKSGSDNLLIGDKYIFKIDR